MMKYFTIFAICFASCLLQSTASSVANNPSPQHSQGFKLNERVRKTRKLSDTDATARDLLRQWKEDDYEELMNVMSGRPNLRQNRKLQHSNNNNNNNGDYQKRPYYKREQPKVLQWQKIALGTIITATVALACYVYALKRELSTLNQYLPLGYKLFPDTDASEEVERPADGVEMS